MKKTNLKSEIEYKKYQVVKFLANLFLTLGILVWVIYVILFILMPSRVEENFTAYLVYWLFTTAFIGIVIYIRYKLINKSIKLSLIIISALFVIFSFYVFTRIGTGSVLPYIILTLLILSIQLVFGKRTLIAFYLLFVIGILCIDILHTYKVLDISPDTTGTNIGGTFVYIFLLGVIGYISKINYDQIEHSYNEAFKYARQLENLNKNLDKKVQVRTSQLKKSLEERVNSIQNVATIGRITRPLMHDLSTPISSLEGIIPLIKKYEVRKENSELLTLAENAVSQAKKIIVTSQDLMNNRILPDECFDPVEAIMNIVNIVQSDLTKSKIEVTFDFQDKIKLKGSTSLFERAITNILMNAIEELQECDKKEKKINILTKKDNKNFIISIKDNGKGINQELTTNLFDHDYSSKDGHLGLGLPFVKSIMYKYFKGEIKVLSKVNKYTQFDLIFYV